MPYEPGFAEAALVPLEVEGNKLQMMLKMSELFTTLCEGALNSTELLEGLKDFDLIVNDGLTFCGALVSERLDIPRVDILAIPPNSPYSFNYMIPMPVSYVPQMFTGFSDKMTFVERAINLGAYLGVKLFMDTVFNRPMDALKVKYNIKPERSFQEAVADAELSIITSDFALEYAQPLLPGGEGSRERERRGEGVGEGGQVNTVLKCKFYFVTLKLSEAIATIFDKIVGTLHDIDEK